MPNTVNHVLKIADQIVFEGEIGYQWKGVGFMSESCRCMSVRSSDNCEDFKIVIQIRKDSDTNYSATIKEFPTHSTTKQDINTRIVSANGVSVEEAYMIARNRFLNCTCQSPPNELYDLGYPRPGFWSWLKSIFQ